MTSDPTGDICAFARRHELYKIPESVHCIKFTNVITGAVAKKLKFKGSEEEDGYWNKGISACAVCDGAAPMFRYFNFLRYVTFSIQAVHLAFLCLYFILLWLPSPVSMHEIRQDDTWKNLKASLGHAAIYPC